MRTIKASEVVKGMRVRVEESLGSDTKQVTEGPVLVGATPYHSEFVDVGLDGVTIGLDPDHPVTVLAEPEPEWVEGAWYWVEADVKGIRDRTPMRRVEGGWSRWEGRTSNFFFDRDEVTVLGRVLIVDWPGDDYASTLEGTYRPDVTWDDFECSTLLKVADAIRTQGGAP